MKKSDLTAALVFTAILLVAAPTALFYLLDMKRVGELNNIQSKVLYVENQKEVSVVKDQVTRKLEDITSKISDFSSAGISRRYGSITGNRIIRNYSYSSAKSKARIKGEFLKYAGKMRADMALLFRNGSVLAANKPSLASATFKRNTKFLQAIPSKKIIQDINFSGGTAEIFVPVIDIKNRVVSVLYIKEDITSLSRFIRSARQSDHGYNFIIDTAGRMLLNTDQSKENSENVLVNPDIKAVINEGMEEDIKEAAYSNLKGLLGYKKMQDPELIACVFTPNIDYKFMQKKTRTYMPAVLETFYNVPVWAILAAILLIGIIIISGVSSAPYKPLKRITRALTHIDEESFEELLPRVKKGDYRKVIDSLRILKGRVNAAEEKAQKLSQMSKELEEELSKEASRADSEISELRDAVKISDNNKAALEEKMLKLKQDKDGEQEQLRKRLENEKSLLDQKVVTLNKELSDLKNELKKTQESKVPAEKENMRTESVLMMNTELKGVLSVIKTYISSVLGGEGKITDAQQQFLGVVINKSARLERLINDLTELAKLEKGEIKLGKQAVDINNIIQDTIFAIQPQADIKKVELKINFSPSLPTGYGDSGRLSNVATQLLNQSIKVSPRGGQVVVETKEGKDDVLARISDFGMSMPQSKANALFVNFHGPESAAGPEFVNTGLRFPILKAVLKNMGGDIWIESEIGKGKTFVLSLPKKPGGGASSAPPPGVSAAPQPPKKEFGIKVGAKPPVPSPPGGAPKIQRNVMADVEKIPASPPPPPPAPKKDVPTVTDLLSFDEKKEQAKKPDLPGKDVKVPPELLKKEEKKPGPPAAPSAPGPQEKKPAVPPPPPAAPPAQKKDEPQPLPDELPPLPELEDDKGTDII